MAAIRIGNIKLVKLFLESGFYTRSNANVLYLAGINFLFKNDQFHMLELIRTEMPALFLQSNFYCGKELLNYIEKQDKNPLTEKINGCIQQQNAIHKLTLLLASISSREDNQDAANKEEVNAEILTLAVSDPTFGGNLVELHFKLLILAGDRALLTYFIEHANIGKYGENINISSAYVISSNDATSLFSTYNDIDLIDSLIKRKKIEMLAFLIETYPKLFQSGRDMYVTAAQYKGLNALAESISRLNSGIDLNDHYLYERSFEDDNTVISISESASNRNYRRFF